MMQLGYLRVPPYAYTEIVFKIFSDIYHKHDRQPQKAVIFVHVIERYPYMDMF